MKKILSNLLVVGAFLMTSLLPAQKTYSTAAEKLWEFNFNLSEDTCPGVLPLASVRFSLDDAGYLIGVRVEGDCLALNKELEKLLKGVKSSPPKPQDRGKVYIITVGIIPVEKKTEEKLPIPN